MPRSSPEITTPDIQTAHDLATMGSGCIFGRSRSGKSNASKFLHAQVDPRRTVAVYVNPHHEDVPESIRVETVDQVIAAIKAKERKIDWRLVIRGKDDQEKAKEDIWKLWRWVERVGQAAMRKKGRVGPWIYLTFGEAHLYAPNTREYTGVDAFLCEGQKFGARVTVESQRPQNVTSESIEQAKWIMCYRLKKAGWIYCDGKGIPVKEFADHVRKKYHFVIVDDDLWTPYIPLPNMD